MSHVTWLTYPFSCLIWMTRSGATYKRVTSLNLTTHSQDARRTHVWRVSFLYVTVLSKNLRRQSEKHICNNTCMACLIRISRTHTHTHTHVTHTHTHTHAHTHTHTRTQVWWISFVHVCNIANVCAHCLLRFFESTVTIFRVWEHPESFEWNSEQILYSNLSLSLHVTFVQCHGAQPFLFCHVPVSSIKKKSKWTQSLTTCDSTWTPRRRHTTEWHHPWKHWLRISVSSRNATTHMSPTQLTRRVACCLLQLLGADGTA